jgi:chromate transporter
MTLPQLFRLFFRVGMSFGAGTGMSAFLQQELVERRQAIARDEFMTLYGLARIVPAGTMTGLAVAVGYRYGGLAGTLVALVAMILPAFVLTVLLTIAYTLLAGSAAFRVLNVTLMPAALAVVIVASLRLGQEFFTPSVELALAVLAFAGVLFVGMNPSLLLIAGGLIGAFTIRRR